MFFQYSFVCPLCEKTVASGPEMIVAADKELVPAEVYKRHKTCPHCSKPLPPGRIKLDIWES